MARFNDSGRTTSSGRNVQSRVLTGSRKLDSRQLNGLRQRRSTSIANLTSPAPVSISKRNEPNLELANKVIEEGEGLFKTVKSYDGRGMLVKEETKKRMGRSQIYDAKLRDFIKDNKRLSKEKFIEKKKQFDAKFQNKHDYKTSNVTYYDSTGSKTKTDSYHITKYGDKVLARSVNEKTGQVTKGAGYRAKFGYLSNVWKKDSKAKNIAYNPDGSVKTLQQRKEGGQVIFSRDGPPIKKSKKGDTITPVITKSTPIGTEYINKRGEKITVGSKAQQRKRFIDSLAYHSQSQSKKEEIKEKNKKKFFEELQKPMVLQTYAQQDNTQTKNDESQINENNLKILHDLGVMKNVKHTKYSVSTNTGVRSVEAFTNTDDKGRKDYKTTREYNQAVIDSTKNLIKYIAFSAGVEKTIGETERRARNALNIEKGKGNWNEKDLKNKTLDIYDKETKSKPILNRGLEKVNSLFSAIRRGSKELFEYNWEGLNYKQRLELAEKTFKRNYEEEIKKRENKFKEYQTNLNKLYKDPYTEEIRKHGAAALTMATYLPAAEIMFPKIFLAGMNIAAAHTWNIARKNDFSPSKTSQAIMATLPILKKDLSIVRQTYRSILGKRFPTIITQKGFPKQTRETTAELLKQKDETLTLTGRSTTGDLRLQMPSPERGQPIDVAKGYYGTQMNLVKGVPVFRGGEFTLNPYRNPSYWKINLMKAIGMNKPSHISQGIWDKANLKINEWNFASPKWLITEGKISIPKTKSPEQYLKNVENVAKKRGEIITTKAPRSITDKQLAKQAEQEVWNVVPDDINVNNNIRIGYDDFGIPIDVKTNNPSVINTFKEIIKWKKISYKSQFNKNELIAKDVAFRSKLKYDLIQRGDPRVMGVRNIMDNSGKRHIDDVSRIAKALNKELDYKIDNKMIDAFAKVHDINKEMMVNQKTSNAIAYGIRKGYYDFIPEIKSMNFVEKGQLAKTVRLDEAPPVNLINLLIRTSDVKETWYKTLNNQQKLLINADRLARFGDKADPAMIFKLSKKIDTKREIELFLKRNNIKINEDKIIKQLELIEMKNNEYLYYKNTGNKLYDTYSKYYANYKGNLYNYDIYKGLNDYYNKYNYQYKSPYSYSSNYKYQPTYSYQPIYTYTPSTTYKGSSYIETPYTKIGKGTNTTTTTTEVPTEEKGFKIPRGSQSKTITAFQPKWIDQYGKGMKGWKYQTSRNAYMDAMRITDETPLNKFVVEEVEANQDEIRRPRGYSKPYKFKRHKNAIIEKRWHRFDHKNERKGKFDIMPYLFGYA